MTRSSIRLRLLLASLLVLPLFLGISGLALDRAFRSYQLQSLQESMRLQQLLLARAADWDGGQWQVGALDEPRFGLADSGLYAVIVGDSGELQWSSPSADTLVTAQVGVLRRTNLALGERAAAIGATHFSPCESLPNHFCYAQRIAWGSRGPEALFIILQSGAAMDAARGAYRGQLLLLSAAMTLFLLLIQALVLSWGLLPLGRVAAAVKALERGEIDRLEGEYPAELRPLTDNLGQLLNSEKRRRERVRSTMDRLTHVLKSPLMLIRNSHEEGAAFQALVQEQVQRDARHRGG